MTRSNRPRLPALARRGIPVHDPSPVQLSLGLRWERPIDRAHVQPEPTPIAPVVVVVARRRAA